MKSTTDRKKELSDFLRHKRASITPDEVGLPLGPNRRTHGLRREEVAVLANVSLTWYTWVEQGKEVQAIFNQSSEKYTLDRDSVDLASHCQFEDGQQVILPDGFVITVSK